MSWQSHHVVTPVGEGELIPLAGIDAHLRVVSGRPEIVPVRECAAYPVAKEQRTGERRRARLRPTGRRWRDHLTPSEQLEVADRRRVREQRARHTPPEGMAGR